MVPGVAAVEIDGLRRALSSPDIDRIRPHVTVVPPVNVREGEVAEACAVVRSAAAESPPLALELGPAASFLPVNPVCYLAVTGSDRALALLSTLSRRLARGPLGPPASRAVQPFVPHVTVKRNMEPGQLASALTVLAGYRTQVVFEDVTVLEYDEAERRWNSLLAVALRRPVTVGRGGVEIELSLSRQLDPVALEWSRREWQQFSVKQYGVRFRADEPLVVTARMRGLVVGVAELELRGDTCRLARLIVGAGHRGSGVGRQLLRAVEDEAAVRGCVQVRLEALAGSPAESFYRGRGFAVVATLSRWREERDFVQLEKQVASISGAPRRASEPAE
jgi:2'-5' RNA ligase/N-acetylglutamate synthase-like GNAT family acetyltransferase